MRGGERIGRLRWSLTCNSQFRHNSRNLRIRGATISSVVSSPEPKFSTVTPDLEALRTWLNDMIASLHFAQLVVLIIGLIARMRDLNLELRKQLLDVRRARPKSETLARVQQQYAFVFAPTGGESPRKPRAGKKPKEKKSRVGVHPGRATLPAHLERIEVMNPVPPELRRCTVCGSEMSTVGHSECEILDIIPARVVVLVRKDERVACPHDDCIVSAPTPPQLIDRGKLGLRLVVECLADKVVEHQPIERLTRRLQRMGVDVAPHTVGRSVVRAMDLLGPIARLIEAKVKGPGVLGTDATGLPVLDRDAPNGIRLGTVWAWTNGPWVCLDYHADATHEGPKAFLGDDLARIVQCDGTSTLSFIERAGGLRPGCMAHGRRRLVTCASGGDALALELLGLISPLFGIEKASRLAGEASEERRQRRDKESRPIIDAIRTWLDRHRGQIPPKTPLGRAIGYLHRQWKRLILFLDDGNIELTNNRRERELRALILGRKNWLFVYQDIGGERLADALTIVASCVGHGIDPRAYLHAVFKRMVEGRWPISRLAELLPHCIGALEPALSMPSE